VLQRSRGSRYSDRIRTRIRPGLGFRDTGSTSAARQEKERRDAEDSQEHLNVLFLSANSSKHDPEETKARQLHP